MNRTFISRQPYSSPLSSSNLSCLPASVTRMPEVNVCDARFKMQFSAFIRVVKSQTRMNVKNNFFIDNKEIATSFQSEKQIALEYKPVSKRIRVSFKGTFVILIIFLAVGFLSCREQEDNYQPLPLTIESAREWFTNEIEKKSTLLRTSFNISRDTKWDKAKKTSDGKFDFVVVPIKHDQLQNPSIVIYNEEDDSQKKEVNEKNFNGFEERLVIFQKGGKNQALLYQHMPDKQYLIRKKFKVETSDFTGFVFVREWNNVLLRAERYIDGVKIYESEAFFTLKNGRLHECSFVKSYITVEAPCNNVRASSTSSTGCYQNYRSIYIFRLHNYWRR